MTKTAPTVARLTVGARAEIVQRLAEDRVAYAGNPEIQTMSRRVLGWMAVAEALLADLAAAEVDRDTWKLRWAMSLDIIHDTLLRGPINQCRGDACREAAALLRPEGTG